MRMRMSSWLRTHRPFARRVRRPLTGVDLVGVEATRRHKDEKLSVEVWEHTGGQGNPFDSQTGRF